MARNLNQQLDSVDEAGKVRNPPPLSPSTHISMASNRVCRCIPCVSCVCHAYLYVCILCVRVCVCHAVLCAYLYFAARVAVFAVYVGKSALHTAVCCVFVRSVVSCFLGRHYTNPRGRLAYQPLMVVLLTTPSTRAGESR